MDQSILHPFVAELRATERLKGFAEAFPAPARVSEPALPLLPASSDAAVATTSGIEPDQRSSCGQSGKKAYCGPPWPSGPRNARALLIAR